MQMQSFHRQAIAFAVAVAALAGSGWVSADPPSRVARLGYMTGAVSFSPAGENDWIQASINRPLTTGDRLWADTGARTEIQIGGALIRMNAGTSLSVLNLDDRIAQLQLTQGTLNVRVRRLESDQVFEVDTPNLAFTLRQPGEYRIEVDPDGNATTIVVRKGQGEVYGEGAAYVIDSRQPYRFTGTGLREYQLVDALRGDEFDRWSIDRDSRYDNSVSARYVSQDVVGYQDLDANGTWRADATYGNVWVPTRVAAGWAPYRDGHWAWVDPWGWTWVDDAPWGFAVSHYGRWTNFGGTWGWVPGPVRSRAYYAPALVAFVGGNNFQLSISSGNVGGIAWFPLGPRDVYRPSYAASRGYFENINRSNTVINTTVINNYYNNTNVTNVVYANQQVPGAVVAVPTTAFVQSQPVSRAAVPVSREIIASHPVAFVPSVAPTERSVRGAAPQGDKPPPRVFERSVVARSAPPVAPVGFAAQQQQLTAKPGRPLEEAARKELKPAAAAPAPVVRVVAQQAAPQPTLRPPTLPPGASPADARGRSDERKGPAPAMPGAPMQSAAPTQAVPSAPIAQPAQQRGNAEQRGQGEQRGQPVPPPQAATPAAPPQAARPAPTAQPPEQRGMAEQRGKGEQRGQPVGQPTAPPPPPVRTAAPPQLAPPQVAAPAPAAAAQSPESRGKPETREQRGQPVASPPTPTERAAEPKAASPQVALPAPVPQPPAQRSAPPVVAPPAQVALPPPAPQRVAQPSLAPPPQAAPPAPAIQQPVAQQAQQPPPRARPEPVPAAKPPEQRLPAAAPNAPPPPPQAASRAAPPSQEQKPAAADPNANKKDADEQKRDEELRRQKK